MLGCSTKSTGIILLRPGSELDANAANASAWAFFDRGMRGRAKWSKSWSKTWMSLRYSSLYWLATSCEPQYAWRFRIFRPWASRRPATSASYSASLLEAWKSSWNDCSRISPVGEVRRTLIHEPCLDEDPSTCRSKVEFGSLFVMSPIGNSTRKSASTWTSRKFSVDTRQRTRLI